MLSIAKIYSVFLVFAALTSLAFSFPHKLGDEKLTNSKPANPNEFPWMAYIKWYLSVPYVYNECAGSIISSEYVLTSCFINSSPFVLLEVTLGAHDLSESSEPGRVVVTCTQTVADPANQIMLIKLGYKIGFTLAIQPIALPLKSDSFNQGLKVTLVGWGRNYPEDPTYLRKPLEKAETSIENKQQCAYPSRSEYFCTSGSGGIGVCMDSGGSVNYFNVAKNNWTLAGVMTNSMNCGNGRPSDHLLVQYFIDWIYMATGLPNPNP